MDPIHCRHILGVDISEFGTNIYTSRSVSGSEQSEDKIFEQNSDRSEDKMTLKYSY